MLYSILTIDKLRVICGLTLEKKIISELTCNKLKWSISKSNKSYFVFVPKWNWYSTHYGREFTVIFQENKVLINYTTFLLFDLQSPFHWIADRNAERKFTTEFEKAIKNNRDRYIIPIFGIFEN